MASETTKGPGEKPHGIGFFILAGLVVCAVALYLARSVLFEGHASKAAQTAGKGGPADGAGRADEVAAFNAIIEKLPQVRIELEVLGEDDVPIEHARVSVEGGNEATGLLVRTTTTDPSGRAFVSLPSLGSSLRVRVEKNGGIVDKWLFDPRLPVHKMRVYLGPAGRVVFRVSDKTGAPIKGARIYLDGTGPEGKTAGDGMLVLEKIPADDHQATVKASRFVRARQEFVVKPGRKVVLSYVLDEAAALDLTCQCEDGPCAGARVELLGAFVDPAAQHGSTEDSMDQGERCDDQGRVFRDDLPGRSIRVVGLYKQRTADEQRGEVEVKLAPGQTSKAVLRFERTGDFAAWVEGTIRTHDGRPAAGATVNAMCGRPEKKLYAGGESKSDGSGHFRIANLLPAPCDLRAWPARLDCPPGVGCAGTPPATTLHTLAPARVDIRLRNPETKLPPGTSDHNHD